MPDNKPKVMNESKIAFVLCLMITILGYYNCCWKIYPVNSITFLFLSSELCGLLDK